MTLHCWSPVPALQCQITGMHHSWCTGAGEEPRASVRKAPYQPNCTPGLKTGEISIKTKNKHHNLYANTAFMSEWEEHYCRLQTQQPSSSVSVPAESLEYYWGAWGMSSSDLSCATALTWVGVAILDMFSSWIGVADLCVPFLALCLCLMQVFLP